MKAKITRGKGFRGALNYAFDMGPKATHDKDAELIGGNMCGENPRELAHEFAAVRAIRPDIEKPVWHSSLRCPAGENPSDDKWNAIAQDYMTRLGIDVEKTPYCIVRHKDNHIHIVASRIALDGSLYLGKNENLKATRISQELEKEHGLTITKGPEYTIDEDGKERVKMPDRRGPSSKERRMMERTGKQSPKQRLQDIIDAAVKDRPTPEVYEKRLEEAGIEWRKGSAGYSYSIEGHAYKGSQLGDAYKGDRMKDRLNLGQENERFQVWKEIQAWKKGQLAELKERQDLTAIEKRAHRAAIIVEAARRKQEIEKGFGLDQDTPGTAGDEKTARKTPVLKLEDLDFRVAPHGNVSFIDRTTGAETYRDTGRQLLFLGHSKSDPAAIANGLRLSREKFGNSFELTGSMEWKKLAAQEAIKLGIEITNKELQPYIAELKKAQGIGQQIKGRELLPEIRDEIKIVAAKIEKNDAWLAANGQIDGITDARRVAENTVTKGVSEAVKKERAALEADALKLATDMAEGKVSTVNQTDVAARITTNEVNTGRLHNYLERPEVQKQVQAEEAKINAVDQDTKEARAYLKDLKKVEKTLSTDSKKDRVYKLEPGTDPRDRRQIVKDIQHQVGKVQKQIDQDKGIGR